MRQSHVPGANMANAAAKADVIREEFEDASQKVENIKVNWFTLLSCYVNKLYYNIFMDHKLKSNSCEAHFYLQ